MVAVKVKEESTETNQSNEKVKVKKEQSNADENNGAKKRVLVKGTKRKVRRVSPNDNAPHLPKEGGTKKRKIQKRVRVIVKRENL